MSDCAEALNENSRSKTAVKIFFIRFSSFLDKVCPAVPFWKRNRL
jgi:hypothetical protein